MSPLQTGQWFRSKLNIANITSLTCTTIGDYTVSESTVQQWTAEWLLKSTVCYSYSWRDVASGPLFYVSRAAGVLLQCVHYLWRVHVQCHHPVLGRKSLWLTATHCHSCRRPNQLQCTQVLKCLTHMHVVISFCIVTSIKSRYNVKMWCFTDKPKQ